MENKSFYNAASGFYDQMINFEANLKTRRESFSRLFSSSGIAADLGCGTGVDSIALSLNGHIVTGFDPSARMLETAKKNSENFSQRIEFLESSILSIPNSFNSKFDLTISLGNTFANVEGTTIYSTVQRLYDILKQDGKCLIHILNYTLILEKKERIVSIKPDDENYFVRFYDFVNGQINFNILCFSKNDNSNYTLLTTQVFGYKKDLLAKVFESVGFKDIQFWSNLEQEPFDITASKDLYVFASK